MQRQQQNSRLKTTYWETMTTINWWQQKENSRVQMAVWRNMTASLISSRGTAAIGKDMDRWDLADKINSCSKRNRWSIFRLSNRIQVSLYISSISTINSTFATSSTAWFHGRAATRATTLSHQFIDAEVNSPLRWSIENLTLPQISVSGKKWRNRRQRRRLNALPVAGVSPTL